MDEATNSVVEATEHYGVFLTSEQEAVCVSRVLAGENARKVVGSLSLAEVGAGTV